MSKFPFRAERDQNTKIVQNNSLYLTFTTVYRLCIKQPGNNSATLLLSNAHKNRLEVTKIDDYNSEMTGQFAR